jgi:uncharacterized membrane protein
MVQPQTESETLTLGLLPKLLFIGFFVIIVGIILLAFSAFTPPSEGGFRGFIFIFPIPFLFSFGYGGEPAPIIPIFAIVFFALVIVSFLLLAYRFSSFSK